MRDSYISISSINIDKSDSISMIKENSSFITYFIKVAKISFPTIMTYEIQVLIWLISTYFLGQLDDPIYLAGAGVANNWIWIAFYSIIIGFGGSIDTLCAQAFGANNTLLFSQYFNSSCILIMTIEAVLLPMTWFSAYFFKYVLQYPEELSLTAETFLRYEFMGIISLLCFELMRRYLRAQQIFKIQVIAVAISSLIHLFLCMIFTRGFGFGMKAIALSYSISTLISALIVFIYHYE